MFFLCVSCFFVVSSSFPLFFLVFSISPPSCLCGIVWGDAIFVHAGPRQNPRQSTPVYGVLCGAIPFVSGILWGDTIVVWYCVG